MGDAAARHVYREVVLPAWQFGATRAPPAYTRTAPPPPRHAGLASTPSARAGSGSHGWRPAWRLRARRAPFARASNRSASLTALYSRRREPAKAAASPLARRRRRPAPRANCLRTIYHRAGQGGSGRGPPSLPPPARQALGSRQTHPPGARPLAREGCRDAATGNGVLGLRGRNIRAAAPRASTRGAASPARCLPPAR